ncbi:hypothetical protein FBEOM_11869 [Fusarium beomiforme]|uniref:Uncharacterized protein n=1 Tax=Fusarium beomiforme TaxID=44412 RepID=A0A9P5A8R8_9HYPO|nr:hypothetical protein FBEOM_11869 [Fusarium beomiforme]
MESFSSQPRKNNNITITSKDVFTQKPKHGPIRSWLWETLSLLFALGLLIATIVIPAQNNNQVLKPWPYDISLNTLIAILSTFMRASMLLVVAELVGQMGWNALQKPRPISDLHHFDNASRGIMGAIKLFWSVPPRFVSIVAALVIIVSPAITPFAQQAVRTVPCSRTVEGAQASLPISHYVPATDSTFRLSAANTQLSGDMRVAMMNGLVNPTGKDIDITATCPTGNCTFPSNSQGVTHSSIAMCSACIDTTELINLKVGDKGNGGNGFVGDVCNFSLPNGQWIQSVSNSQIMVMSGDLDWALETPDSKFAQLTKVAISNLTTLSFTQSGCNVTDERHATCPEDRLSSKLPKAMHFQNAIAASCTLYPCIKKYNGKVEQGTLIEKVVNEQPVDYNRATNDVAGDRKGVQTPCLINGKEYNLANFSRSNEPTAKESLVTIDGTNYTVPIECVYTLTFGYRQALSSFMEKTLFNTLCTANIYSGSKGQLDCGDQWWLPPLYNSTFDGLNAAFGVFSTAITNNFRKQRTKGKDIKEVDKVLGQATEMAICTVFDWRWVLLPAGLMAITLVLLIVAVVQGFTNPRMPVWKTSILPLLFYGPNVVERTQETGLDDLQKEAGRIVVRIDHDDVVRVNQVDTRGTES